MPIEISNLIYNMTIFLLGQYVYIFVFNEININS